MRPQRKASQGKNATRPSKKAQKGSDSEEDHPRFEQRQQEMDSSPIQAKRGRPLKSEDKIVHRKDAQWHEKVLHWMKIYLKQYLQQLEPSQTNWDRDGQTQINKIQLLKIAETSKKLDKGKIDELAYVITRFGGRITFPFREEFYKIMLHLVTRSWDWVWQLLATPKGKKKFPYLTLNIQGYKYTKRPTEERIYDALKLFLQKMKQEVQSSYYVQR